MADVTGDGLTPFQEQARALLTGFWFGNGLAVGPTQIDAVADALKAAALRMRDRAAEAVEGRMIPGLNPTDPWNESLRHAVGHVRALDPEG